MYFAIVCALFFLALDCFSFHFCLDFPCFVIYILFSFSQLQFILIVEVQDDRLHTFASKYIHSISKFVVWIFLLNGNLMLKHRTVSFVYVVIVVCFKSSFFSSSPFSFGALLTVLHCLRVCRFVSYTNAFAEQLPLGFYWMSRSNHFITLLNDDENGLKSSHSNCVFCHTLHSFFFHIFFCNRGFIRFFYCFNILMSCVAATK